MFGRINILLTLPPLIFTSSVLAEEQRERVEKPKAKFKEGVSLYSDEKYEEALAAFELSYELAPKPVVLLNIAMCQKAIGDHAGALGTFKNYLQVSDKNKYRRRVELAEQMVAELRPIVGWIFIEAMPSDAEVRLNDQPAIISNNSFAVNPGEHRLEISKPGYKSLQRSISVLSSSIVQVNGVLEPEINENAFLDPEDIVPKAQTLSRTFRGKESSLLLSFDQQHRQTSKLYSILGGTSLGLSCVGLGLGIYFAYLRQTRDYDDAVGAVSQSDYDKIEARAKAHVVGSAVSFISAGVFAGIGALLFRKNNRGKKVPQTVLLPSPYGLRWRF